MRPFLHEFLTSAYEHYDIVIWSATGMKWIEEKMRLLGVSSHSDYKIMFYLDYLAMITVHTMKYGTIDVSQLLLLIRFCSFLTYFQKSSCTIKSHINCYNSIILYHNIAILYLKNTK